MRQRIFLLLLLGIVTSIQLSIQYCIECSKVFSWWNDIIPSVNLNFIPIFFTITALGFLIFTFLIKEKNKIQKIFKTLLLILCFANVCYWIYVLVLLRLVFFNQYATGIILHVGLMYFVSKNYLDYVSQTLKPRKRNPSI